MKNIEHIKDRWEEVLNILKEDLTGPSYATWIAPLKLLSIDNKNNKIFLSTYDDFSQDILQKRYAVLIENSINEIFGTNLKAIFLYPDETGNHDGVQTQILGYTDELYLNPKYIFDSFVCGSSNEFAHAASLAVAESPGIAYNPLFIWGSSGLGKTHLIHAIGHKIMQQNSKLKVLYVSSEMFTNEIILAIKTQKTAEFRKKYRLIDVLMIDDIQFIENKDSTREEFFHTFNTLYENNKQIIITSDRQPKDIKGIEDRLRSRFEWGLIADIQAPDYETRVAILEKKAELDYRNILFISSEPHSDIKPEVKEIISLIAEKMQYNVRELEGSLNRIVAHGSLTKKEINMVLAKEVLKDIFHEKNIIITPNLIKEKTCSYFNIKISDMDSSKRTRNFVFPRQIAMYLCRDLIEGLSLPKIGENFGNRDHTTVIHACDKISKEMKINSNLKEIISFLINEINKPK